MKKAKSIKGSAVSKTMSAKAHMANRLSRGGGKGAETPKQERAEKKGGYC